MAIDVPSTVKERRTVGLARTSFVTGGEGLVGLEDEGRLGHSMSHPSHCDPLSTSARGRVYTPGRRKASGSPRDHIYGAWRRLV